MIIRNGNPSHIQVFRGDMVESAHLIHAAVVNRKQELVAYTGNPFRATFARSTAKPLQALAVLAEGALARWSMTAAEIALLCASHNGEPQHAQAVKHFLHKLGLDESALQCGIHPPLHEPTRLMVERSGMPLSPLYNNCSGKHMGMLALSVLLQADIHHYLDPDHPVQQRMLDVISALSSVPKAEIVLATDGCGVPVFGLPLDRLAYAYSQFGKPEQQSPSLQQASAAIIQALRQEPFYLAGSERFDTRLIEVTSGRLIGKMGVEGVFTLTLPDTGLAMAIKVEDGSERALYPAVVEILLQLNLLAKQELADLAAFHQPEIINHKGERVGSILPAIQLITSSD